MKQKTASGFAGLFRNFAKARRAPGNPNLPYRSSPLRFESLESRLLLSADLVGATFDSGHDLVLRDADGTRVTFNLRGAGSGSVIADGNSWDVVLADTNAQTTFSVKARGGDGRVTLDDIRIEGSIKAIDAPTAYLTGTLAADGAVGAGVLIGGASGALIAAPSLGLNSFGFNLGGIIILGDLEDSEILIGADLGADGQPGGTGAAADTFGQGSMTLFAVLGSVNDSVIRVGQDPVNGVFDDCDDVIRGGTDSRIGIVLIGDELSSDSRIIAGRVPPWAFVDGRTIRTAGDPRFKTDVQGPEVELALANDTGASTADGLTFDPSIVGNVIDAGGIAGLWAGFGSAADVDIRDELAADGSFLLSRSDLEEIYGAPLADGSYTLTIEATDAQGNGCPHDVSFTLDSMSPTVTINQAPGQEDPASGGPILFTVEFSEPVTGFSGAGLSFAGSTFGEDLVAEVTGSGATYAVLVTGMSGSGTVVASIPAGAASDAAGNASSASSSTDNSVTLGSNQAPVAGEDLFTLRPGQTEVITFARLLEGDTDADGDALRVVSVDAQVMDVMGNVVADVITDLAAGTIQVVPRAEFPFFTGAGRFNYRITDDLGGFDDGEVTIIYANQAPVAGEDLFTSRPGQTELITFVELLDDDTDADGDALRLIDVDRQVLDALGNVVAEVVEVNFEQGTLLVAPAAPFFTGAGRFSYRITDDFGGFDDGEVTITYVNQAPVAGDDTYTTDEDTVLTIAMPGVLGNDTDVDSAVLTAAVETGPAHGTLALNADGSFAYTPDANFSGADSFTYRVSDGDLSHIGLVSITVDAVNDAPVAGDDSYSVDEDAVLIVTMPGVSGNDTDVDSVTLTAAPETGPAHGTLALNADGSFTYTPNPDFNGTDSFTYRVSDGDLSHIGLVSITVNAVNDAPVAGEDFITMSAGLTGFITFAQLLDAATDADGDALQVVSFDSQVLDDMGNVVAEVMVDAWGRLIVMPTGEFPPFTGAGLFRYQIADGFGGVDEGEVTLTYVINDAPMAGEDVITLAPLDAGQTAVITAAQLLVGDEDPNGDALEVVWVDWRVMDVMGNIVAEVVMDAQGQLTVTAAAGFELFTGAGRFSYQISDGLGGFDDGDVTLIFEAPLAPTGQSGLIDWNARPDPSFTSPFLDKRSSGAEFRDF